MWGKFFHQATSIEKSIQKREVLAKSIEKNLVDIDPLTINNAVSTVTH